MFSLSAPLRIDDRCALSSLEYTFYGHFRWHFPKSSSHIRNRLRLGKNTHTNKESAEVVIPLFVSVLSVVVSGVLAVPSPLPPPPPVKRHKCSDANHTIYTSISLLIRTIVILLLLLLLLLRPFFCHSVHFSAFVVRYRARLDLFVSHIHTIHNIVCVLYYFRHCRLSYSQRV